MSINGLESPIIELGEEMPLSLHSLHFISSVAYTIYAQFLLKGKKSPMSLTSPFLSCFCLCLSVSGVVSRWGGNHGEAVAVCDAGSRHGSAGTDLPEALRMSDPVTQPGDPLRQERSIVCTAEH